MKNDDVLIVMLDGDYVHPECEESLRRFYVEDPHFIHKPGHKYLCTRFQRDNPTTHYILKKENCTYCNGSLAEKPMPTGSREEVYKMMEDRRKSLAKKHYETVMAEKGSS